MLLPLADRTLCYDLLGPEDGQVVAFMHPLAADMGVWTEQVPPLLKEGYRVLRMDLRGHGGSRAAEGPYTMDALADDMIDVVNALHIDRFHFVGLSIGGAIGQSLALRYPDRLYSAFLCDTQSESFPNAAAHWGSRIEKLKQAGSVAGLADDTLGRWLTAEYRDKNPPRWAQIRDTVAGCSVYGYTGCVQALAHFSYTDRLGRVTLPVLIGCGSDDPSATPEASRQLASRFAKGRFESFAEAKHLPNVEQPQAFNSVLLGWLAEVRQTQ